MADCSRHRDYLARRPPISNCPECWDMYYMSLQKPQKRVKGKQGSKRPAPKALDEDE